VYSLPAELPNEDEEVLLLQGEILPERVLPRELLLQVVDVEQERLAVQLVLSFENRFAAKTESKTRERSVWASKRRRERWDVDVNSLIPRPLQLDFQLRPDLLERLSIPRSVRSTFALYTKQLPSELLRLRTNDLEI
jgi:hypothetical protein